MNLVELDRGVFAFIDPSPAFGRSNVGLVIDADGLTVYDTTATPTGGERVRQAIVELTAQLDLPIKRVLLSSSRIAFSGGGQPFWASAFYGSDATSDQLDAPPNPHAFRRLLPDFAFSYTDDFATRPITHTVSEPAWLTPATHVLPLEGESAANLVLRVEAANVVFCGALASFGVTPLGYDANPVAWISSLHQVLELGKTIIPGHGMPGGTADVHDLIGYLTECVNAGGDVDRIGPGPWDDWTDRRFDAVNVERAAQLARGVDQIPQSMFALLDLL
jgi:glyoxylase-like metal-dependent hydrolase (beta-lactamase superfamily II)